MIMDFLWHRVSEKEKEELFSKYGITIRELPKILLSDPAIKELSVQEGDVIKIMRKSQTSGDAFYYRGVISG